MVKEKISEAVKLCHKTNSNYGMHGKKHSEETKHKMSLARKGWIPSEETKLKRKESILKRYGKFPSWTTGKKATPETIKKLIESHLGKSTGKDHPNWKGGISYQGHDSNFNEQFRRKIRIRDNQICMLCLIHREKLNRSMQVHHINYDKQLTIPQNCISLCNSCHMKTNFNRKHWVKLFHDILNEKYGYIYSDDNEVIVDLNKVKVLGDFTTI